MSEPQLPVPLPTSPSGWAAALPYVLSAVTLVGGWFAAQFTAVAQLQKTLLDASRDFVGDSQAQHARDGVRILELEREVLRLREESNAHIQWVESVKRWAARSGYELPGGGTDAPT